MILASKASHPNLLTNRRNLWYNGYVGDEHLRFTIGQQNDKASWLFARWQGLIAPAQVHFVSAAESAAA